MASVTASDLIGQAFRRLGVTAEGEQPSAEEASDALTTLNTMLHGFKADGIDYAHTDLALSSTVNFPDEELAMVRDLLANELAPGFSAPVDRIAGAILNAKRTLQARYTFLLPATLDKAVIVRRNYNDFGTNN